MVIIYFSPLLRRKQFLLPGWTAFCLARNTYWRGFSTLLPFLCISTTSLLCNGFRGYGRGPSSLRSQGREKIKVATTLTTRCTIIHTIIPQYTRKTYKLQTGGKLYLGIWCECSSLPSSSSPPAIDIIFLQQRHSLLTMRSYLEAASWSSMKGRY